MVDQDGKVFNCSKVPKPSESLDRVCPLLAMGAMANSLPSHRPLIGPEHYHGQALPGDCGCLGEHCQWWDAQVGNCAVSVLAMGFSTPRIVLSQPGERKTGWSDA